MMQRKHPSEAMTGAPGALPGEAIRVLTQIVAPEWLGLTGVLTTKRCGNERPPVQRDGR